MSKQKTKIPEGWKHVKLGEIIKFQGGFAFKTTSYKNSGMPLVRIGNVGKGYFDSTNFVYLDEDLFNEQKQFQLRTDDILMGMTGDLGKVCKIKEKNLPALLNQRVGRVIVKNKDEVDNNFIYQLFLSAGLQTKFEKHFEGMAQKNISPSQVESVEILLPSLAIQNKIAEILGTVDEDIEKTDNIIAEVETIKSGMMKNLFASGITHKGDCKMTKLGVIPVEWEVVTLGSVSKVERGKFSHRPRNDLKFFNGVIPFIQTSEVVGCNGKITNYRQTLNDEGLKISKMFLAGTIVLTIAANIGDTGILQFDACFPDSLVGIKVNQQMDAVFLEYYLRTRKEYLNSIATQSAQKNINLEKLNPLLIVKPSLREQKQIAEILSAIDNKILIYKKIKDNLIQLKKGLAFDLLSGSRKIEL